MRPYIYFTKLIIADQVVTCGNNDFTVVNISSNRGLTLNYYTENIISELFIYLN